LADKQVTAYVYNDDHNAALATTTVYPDSASSTDVVTVAHHLDGSVKHRIDQRGVKIAYTYDDARRVTYESASGEGDTLDNLDVDDSVQSIGRAYDDLGRITGVTSYGGVDGGGAVVNQIAYVYNPSHGRLAETKLSHSGAVGGSTPKVTYTYDTSTDNGQWSDALRPFLVYLPTLGSNARIEYFTQDSGTIRDRMNLLGYTAIYDGDLDGVSTSRVHTVYPEFTGSGRLVTAYSSSSLTYGVNAKLSYYGSSGDYSAWDRWGRVTRQEWKQGSTTLDRFDYAYDNAGNRTSRSVPGDVSGDQDQAYGYDGLHRLRSSEQSTASDDKSWDLDQLGNWEGYTYGATAQTRSHNEANELETISNWADPAYDDAGNMTSIPKPKDLANSFGAKYDAWNRLTQLDGGTTASYQYDGLGRRIVRTEGATTKRFYYNERWQVLVEADGADDAQAIYSHHPHYIDAVAVRMTPTGDHFYLHDALFNVTALVERASEDVVERYAYNPYGEATVLDASYAADSATGDGLSDVGNEKLYTGRRIDPSTGFQINRNRYYNQQLGRWISRDPAGYEEKENLYEFMSGKPISYTDPHGLKSTNPICCNYKKEVDYVKSKCLWPCGYQLCSESYGYEAGNIGYAAANSLGFSATSRDHSAIRHCVAVGILSLRCSCHCAQCANDERDYFQTACKGQPPLNYKQSVANGYIGRRCAGCSGGGSLISGPHSGLFPSTRTPTDVINCCINEYYRKALQY
jgi:RHS repeat-associated protein